MFGRPGNMKTAMLAALLLGAGSGGAFASEAVTYQGGWTAPRLIGGNGDQRKVGNYPRSGRAKTAAQIKRASKKARNVARHKKHAR